MVTAYPSRLRKEKIKKHITDYAQLRNSRSTIDEIKKRKRVFYSSEDGENEAEISSGLSVGQLSDTQRALTDERALREALEKLSSCDIAALASEWLGEVETARGKSSNIKGSLTKIMKVDVHSAGHAIRTLAVRASAEGDPGFLRNRILELQEELAEAKLQIQKLTNILAEKVPGAAEGLMDMNADAGAQLVDPPQIDKHPAEATRMVLGSPTNIMEGLREQPKRREEIPVAGPSNQVTMDKGFLADLAATIKIAMAEAITTMIPGSQIGGRQRIGAVPPLDRGHLVKEGGYASGKDRREEVHEGTVRDQPRKRETRAAENPPLARRTREGLPSRRPPRSSAVTLSCPEGGMSYAEAIRTAREKIVLDDLGIADTRMRNTVSGGVLIELPGSDRATAADALASKLRDAFQDTGVRVGRPTMKGELRLSGLDASVTAEEVLKTVVETGCCRAEDVRLGNARIARNGTRTVWLQCPLDAALKIVDTGGLRIGWATARVELLRRRPLQCYRCLGIGHVRWRCPSDKDRTGYCFNCEEADHKASECGRPASCPVCKDRGLPHNHRAGSGTCPPLQPRRSPAKNTGREERTNTADRSNVAVASTSNGP
ncbi:PREDICTED: uncharacterized protein LOC105448018 [Wasmannia auropunctata]|uniref:uncharacterized protein LOC105448018 n=1 Tax=Wasmannia auropunctata TaxID=64793 RepID=UPI0005ED5B54|nr:PREDICTED: uncharacterized protein LOC105448018 [Wasmannia auropunctata]